jgi:hypothetical protein
MSSLIALQMLRSSVWFNTWSTCIEVVGSDLRQRHLATDIVGEDEKRSRLNSQCPFFRANAVGELPASTLEIFNFNLGT